MPDGMHLTALGDGLVLLEPRDSLDPAEPDAYHQPLLEFLLAHRAVRLVYDLSGVPLIDDVYYQWLLSVSRLCGLYGMEMIATNVRPTAAYALARAIGETPPFECARDVDSARVSASHPEMSVHEDSDRAADEPGEDPDASYEELGTRN